VWVSSNTMNLTSWVKPNILESILLLYYTLNISEAINIFKLGIVTGLDNFLEIGQDRNAEAIA
jgi:hypothetical protein